MKEQEQARLLFGLSLSDRPKWQQFLICSSGFFFGYLVNGVCEVLLLNPTFLISRILHVFQSSWFVGILILWLLLFCQTGPCFVLSYYDHDEIFFNFFDNV